MKPELLPRLRCPQTNQRLTLEPETTDAGEVQNGGLISEDGCHRYAIRRGIPRFVPESTYADNFGMQWNHFRRTQLDSHSGHPISADRFWTSTGWQPADLAGKWVLDAGCGSGRFAEIALAAAANVVAMDLSSAVDATYANLRKHPGLHVVQADIYRMPFAAASFDFVYSLGVLQHTPDVKRAFDALPPLLTRDGRLCVDYYRRTWRKPLLPQYWLRPLTKRLPKATLFSSLEKVVPFLLPISRGLSAIPVAGPVLKRVVPVIDYHGVFPFTEQQHHEWSLLDTFDMLAPEYDEPQTARTARAWMEEAGLTEVETLGAGLVVARGRNPS